MAAGRLFVILSAGAVLCAAPVFASVAEVSKSFAIEWQTAGSSPAVEVTGLPAATLTALEHEARQPAEWAELFVVLVAPSTGQIVPPMAGSWRVAEGRLRFEPRFPFARGVRYRAEFRPAQLPGGAAGRAPLTAFFQLSAEKAESNTVVAQIYPSAAVLPENQLKFYVQFSAPMSRGSIYEHIHLRDAIGRDLDLPFLDIDEELWNPAMTRLTLLIDPGRIKRGVKPLEDLGAVFEAGKSYTLSIDAGWQDASSRPLRAPFRKEFRIGPADRTPPNPARWSVTAPRAGTLEPLTVIFDEPMDWALASRLIRVADGSGATLEGETTLGEQERRWTWVPASVWSAGAHALVVATTIEDLAGNNIGKVFDVDLFESVERTFSTTSVRVPFEVR